MLVKFKDREASNLNIIHGVVKQLRDQTYVIYSKPLEQTFYIPVDSVSYIIEYHEANK